MQGKSKTIEVRYSVELKKTENGHHRNRTVIEAYEQFPINYPDSNISRSKFSELHPKYVILSSQIQRNVGACMSMSMSILSYPQTVYITNYLVYLGTQNSSWKLSVTPKVSSVFWTNAIDARIINFWTVLWRPHQPIIFSGYAGLSPVTIFKKNTCNRSIQEAVDGEDTITKAFLHFFLKQKNQDARAYEADKTVTNSNGSVSVYSVLLICIGYFHQCKQFCSCIRDCLSSIRCIPIN